MKPGVSVFIPVYQDIRTLALSLTGLENQSFKDFEVVIGDDGSGPEMKKFIQGYRPSFSVKYVWHPDEGFRRSKILNTAFKEGAAAYCIFMDADCIPHHHFVSDHMQYRSAMTVLCGRRINFGERVSRSLSIDDVRSRRHENITIDLVKDILAGKTINWEESLRVPFLRFIHWKLPTLLGSNFSLDRTLFETVNGFNEDYVGYGMEDSELALRFQLAGAKLKLLRHVAIQYHLYHEARGESSENKAKYEKSMSSKDIMCRNGLKKLS